MIHSIGIYQSHKRISTSSFENYTKEKPISELTYDLSADPSSHREIGKEHLPFIYKLERKYDILVSKMNQISTVIKSYGFTKQEIESNYDKS